MKLNTRTIAMAAVLGAVVAANAADVRFFLAYGDAGFAAANGAAMGDELKATSIVGAVGSTFTVSVMVQSTATADALYSGGCMFVGFDTATTNNSTTGYADRATAEAAGTSKMLRLDTAYSSYGSGAGVDSGGADTTVTTASQGAAKFRGVAKGGSSASLRSIGLNQAIQWGTGNKLKLAAGSKFRLADMVVTNMGINNGTYGDGGDENGLTLNSSSPATSGSNFMGNTAAGNPNADVKYALTNAVPEPGTVIAVAAGLVALAARRRRK